MQEAVDDGARGRDGVGKQVVAVFRFALDMPSQARVRFVARPLQFLGQPPLAFLSWQLGNAVRR